MRGPIGLRISSRRRTAGLSQAELARRAGISASYLNLIERNKREVGGSLLRRIAEQLSIDVGDLSGEAEHRLIAEVEEALADPVLNRVDLQARDARDLVAQHPAAAEAIARLHRAYLGAIADTEDYANRLRSDPLLGQLLHRVLSGITAVRSGAEILSDVPDLDDDERARFVGSVRRESQSLTDVAHSLIGQFESDARGRRSISPMRELDDLIFERNNYFGALEAGATELRSDIERRGAFGEATLVAALGEQFGVEVTRSADTRVDDHGFPGQYRFDTAARVMWFQTNAVAATRQFQLTRLYAELAARELIEQAVSGPEFTSSTSRRLAYRALSSYLAGAIVFPYDTFLEAAETSRYDIASLRQAFTASFEQVAHRMVTLRKPNAAGIPFGFLRSDPAGRLTKHFPLAGLPMPGAGHACPLWGIYAAFRSPEQLVRQVVRFADGSRYLFLAQAQSRRVASFTDRAVNTSVMLACDVLHADRTVYAAGLDLLDPASDVPVGPACRLCPRLDCPDRQEEALGPGGQPAAVRAPLIPTRFDIGEPE